MTIWAKDASWRPWFLTILKAGLDFAVIGAYVKSPALRVWPQLGLADGFASPSVLGNFSWGRAGEGGRSAEHC